MRDILEGTYTFLPDTDKWTAKILEEAHHTFALLADKTIDSTISVSEFQGYWQRANEAISSSFSRLHFGHYKAASFSKDLSALHAAKLTACGKKGIPLSRIRSTKCVQFVSWKAISIITTRLSLLVKCLPPPKKKIRSLLSALQRKAVIVSTRL